MTKKETAIKLTQAFSTGDAAFAKQVLKPDFIQHNLKHQTGAQVIIDALKTFAKWNPKPNVKVVRALEEGNFVVIHATYDFGQGAVVTLDVYRFEKEQIAEFWDSIQPLAKTNLNGHTQLDGSIEINDLTKTLQNKAVVLAFQKALRKNDLTTAQSYLKPGYIEHNADSNISFLDANGSSAKAAKNNQSIQLGKIHHVIGEGNFVFTSSEGQIANNKLAIFELFRLNQNQIVEHWDVISPIIDKTHPDWVNNPNGKW